MDNGILLIIPILFMETDEIRNNILKGMLQDNTRSVQVVCLAITDDATIERYSILDLLGAKESMLTMHGKEVLKLIEGNDAPCKELYLKLKWSVLAFLTVQDTFDVSIYNTNDPSEAIGLKNYFYYESLHLLHEYIYCGLNNCLSSARHLLRTIIEFNIKQLYFEETCSKIRSYRPLLEYLRNGKGPSAVSMVSKIFKDYIQAKPLKKSISSLHSQLSKTASHAYIPIYSDRSSGKIQHEYSIDSVVFWVDLYIILSQILWMYYFCHPQLFNPKDIIKKFGFNPPCGCFITKSQHVAIERSLCRSDYEMFKSLALNSDKVVSLNAMYDSCDTLSHKQIQDTWDANLGEAPKNTNMAFYSILAQQRAVQEMLAGLVAGRDREEQEKSYANISDEALDTIVTYSWTMKNYKNL